MVAEGERLFDSNHIFIGGKNNLLCFMVAPEGATIKHGGHLRCGSGIYLDKVALLILSLNFDNHILNHLDS